MHPFIAKLVIAAAQAEQTIETAGQEVANAAAGTEGAADKPADTGFGGSTFWIMMILLFGVMWFFMIRPQRKQQKEMENFRKSLQKGDKVVTVGGIYGEIVEVNETTALIKVDGDTKLRVAKNGLQKDFTPQQ